MMRRSVFARVLFFASLWKLPYAFNGSIEIERHDINYTNGNQTYQPDTFKLPSTVCSSDISVYCGVMGGHSVGGNGCKCECNSAEETTFGFYDDQWKCTANSKVRQYAGCSLILLSDRTEDSALITVPRNMEADIPYVMPTSHQRCYIIPFQSTYLLCNGSRKILDSNFVFSRFSIAERNSTQFFTFNRTKRDFWYNKVNGRILRITIGCYNTSNAIIRNCLLLKMQGKMMCPQVFLPPLPTASTWTTPTSSRGTHSTRILISQQTTVKYLTFADKRKKNGAEENDGDNTGLIVGVAVGVIGLTLIVIVIVIIKKQRTKRNAVVAKCNTTVENISYELGADNSLKITNYDSQKSVDQDEYSYAYTNAVPLGRRNMSNTGHNKNQGPEIAVSNHVYGKVIDLDKHGSPSQTSASTALKTLEVPEYAEVNKPNPGVKNPSNSDGPMYNKKGVKPQKTIDSQKEPLYNVLEDPGSLNEPLERREAPFYQVLEGPFSEGTPAVYNVLEQPPLSDNPPYISLEGQTPRVYSTLNRGDDTKGAVKQTRNYNDTVYDSVGEVINDTSDVYQKLNQNDETTNKELYQALSNGDNTLRLNQLELTPHENV